MSSTKKKVASPAAAVGVAAAMALGGTFAWQSISQTALNEASDVVDPGGRLHDDFNGENKDVYVENFADEPIIARIRLAEYFEIVMNKGTGAEKSIPILGSKSEADGKVTYSYKTFEDYSSLKDGVVSAGLETTGTGEAATTRSYWSWKTGGSTVYMPTFNKNKDSLAADLNGEYVGAVGGISDRDGTQYTGYVDWSTWKGENDTTGVGATKSGTEIYDADANDADEVGTDFDNLSKYEAAGNVAVIPDVQHAAKQSGTAELMSMGDWLDMVEEADSGYDPSVHGSYWVYDADGWVYWAQTIPGRNEDGTTNATGLLLDGIELNQVMDDTWYYAIDVTAQFITADDLGDPGEEGEDGEAVAGTGFYADGLSDEALALLAAIGVGVPDYDEGREEPSITYILVPGGDGKQDVYKEETAVFQGDSLYVEVFDENGSPISWEGVDVYVDNEEGTQNSYQYSTEGIETYSDWEGKRAITPQAKILIPEDAPVGELCLNIELPNEEGTTYFVYVTVLGAEGDASAAPTFVVNDMTNTAVLGYNLSSGDNVVAYQNTKIKVVSTDASTNWTVSGYTNPDPGGAGAPARDEDANSYYLFNIGAGEPIGTKIVFSQTAGDGEAYTLNVFVTAPPATGEQASYTVKLLSETEDYDGSLSCVDTYRRFKAGTKIFFSVGSLSYDDIAAFVVPAELTSPGISDGKCCSGHSHTASLQIPADIESGSYEVLAIGKDGAIYAIPIDVVVPWQAILTAWDGGQEIKNTTGYEALFCNGSELRKDYQWVIHLLNGDLNDLGGLTVTLTYANKTVEEVKCGDSILLKPIPGELSIAYKGGGHDTVAYFTIVSAG